VGKWESRSWYFSSSLSSDVWNYGERIFRAARKEARFCFLDDAFEILESFFILFL
jgi:hypothetical protein